MASGPLAGRARRRPHRDGHGPVLHPDHGRHGRGRDQDRAARRRQHPLHLGRPGAGHERRLRQREPRQAQRRPRSALRRGQGRAARARSSKADVFIHSMRAKAIAKLGFGYEDVAAINPTIVYTNCYGYGRRGPDADLPAYDDTIQAECGLAGRPAAAHRRSELRRHDHGRQGRRADRALRHDDGAVPPRAHRRRPGSRSQHVRDDGLVHARRARQRRDVRPAARPGASTRARWRRTASRTGRRTATSPR